MNLSSPDNIQPPRHMRPQSVTELVELPINAAVFDAHDGVPDWLASWPCQRMEINQSLAQWILFKIIEPRIPINKMVYLVAKDDERLTMVCIYDFRGFIYTIEL